MAQAAQLLAVSATSNKSANVMRRKVNKSKKRRKEFVFDNSKKQNREENIENMFKIEKIR